MRSRSLHSRPNLEQYRKQAKDLLRQLNAGDAEAVTRFRQHHPEGRKTASPRVFRLSEAQCVLAREHGADSWPQFVARIEAVGRSASASADAPHVSQLLVPTPREVNLGVFLRDGTQILTATEAEPVRLWNVADGTCLREFGDYTNHAWALKVAGDGRSAVIGCRDGAVRVVDLDEDWVLKTLTGHRGFVRCVDATSSVSTVISGGMQDQTLRVWDTASARCTAILEGHRGGLYCVALDAAGHRALSGSRDGTIRLWELKSGRCSRVIDAHAYHVHAVAWAADGRRALSCSQDIRLWDLDSGNCIRVLDGHTKTIRSVAWSPDERLALSAAHDRTVRVWDVERGACVHVFSGHAAGAINAVWGPGGQILSCDWTGEIRTFAVGGVHSTARNASVG